MQISVQGAGQNESKTNPIDREQANQQTNVTNLENSQTNMDISETITDEELKNCIQINDRFFKKSDDPKVN